MYRRTFLRAQICLLIFLSLMSVAHAQQKITGPWLWMIAPTEVNRGGRDSTDVDSIAIASNGAVTESDIATKGANEGDRVGNLRWTLGRISPTGGNNVNDTITSIGLGRGDINDHSSYALITLESNFDQNGVTMRVGSDDSVKVWLNGQVVHKFAVNRGAGDFQDTFQVDIKRGDNLLLVKVSERGGGWSMFVGIDAHVTTKVPIGSVNVPPSTEAGTRGADTFDDPFEGRTLQNPNWEWQNEPANWDIGETRDNFLHIESEPNRNLWISDASHFLYQETDADAFDVETHFFSRWDTSFGVNGLVVKSPADNNWVTLKFWSRDAGAKGQIQYQARGRGLVGDPLWRPEFGATELFFRLRKDGNTYTGWYKTRESETWIEIGTANVTLTPPLQLGIYAGVAANTGTLTVDYEYFRNTKGFTSAGDVSITPPGDVGPDSAAAVTVSISPSPVQSPAVGKQLVLNLNITDGEDVAGYQATVAFDTTALRYVSSANGSYLPAGAFVVPTLVNGNQITVAATSLTGGSQGDGTLATLTFEVIDVKSSVLTLSGVELTDTNADFLSVRSENGEVVTSEAPTEAVMSLTPSPVASPASGEQLTFNVSITNGKNVAGYAFKLAFDTTALRYISSGNADYLPTGAFVIPPLINVNQITLAAASLNGGSQGEGTLATFTFEVVAVKPSTLRFSEVSLTDSDANVLPVSSENGEIVKPVRVPADVNGDGVVNLEDMDLAASRLNQRGENTADVNGDGVVDAADLLLIAAAVEQGNAAPSLHPKAIAEMFTATEVQQWLQFAHQHGLTGAKYQRGVMLLEQFLLILTPKETAILPNYPNPFNPETWIPYHLSNAAEVHISIYAADGKLVRRLWGGHQVAGIYESRSRAAYWDGRNQLGESVASGIYFYTLTAGDFAATRKLLIRK